MCTTCGCNQPSDAVTIQKIGEEKTHKYERVQHEHEHFLHVHHDHVHDHKHGDHHHDNPVKTLIELEQDILSKNNLMAERNRGFLEAKKSWL